MTSVDGPIFYRPSADFANRLSQLSLLGLVLAGSVSAAPLGIVSDNHSNLVNIFNADTDVVTSIRDVSQGLAMGDCAVASDEKRGFTSSNNNEITFLTLGGLSGQESHQQKRVEISNLGVDMALSPDDSLLVMAGGGSLQQPLSVVDISLEKEISTSGPFVDHTSVEFCDNGTMLVTTTHGEHYGQGLDNALYDVSITGAGEISLEGNRLSSGAQPNNAVCAPGSFAGVLLDREGGLTSFTFPGLVQAQYQSLGNTEGVAAVFSRDGRSLFVRTTDTVEAFDFDPLEGEMTARWKTDLPDTSTFYGVEQIAIHPDGKKLYVDGGGPLMILDPENGLKVGDIPFGDTTGICFANNAGPPLEQEVALVKVQ